MDQLDPSVHAPRSFSVIRIVLWLLVTVAIAVIALPVAILIVSTDTRYAPGYTEAAFDAVSLGDSEDDVIRALGAPLDRWAAEPFSAWLYCDGDHPGFREDGNVSGTYTLFRFQPDGRVKSVSGQVQEAMSEGAFSVQFRVSVGENSLGISPEEKKALIGRSQREIEALYGRPSYRREQRATEYLIYSRSPSSSNYQLRRIGVDATGKVVAKLKYFYWD